MATVTIYASATPGGLDDGYIRSESDTWSIAQAGTGTKTATVGGPGSDQMSDIGINLGDWIDEAFFPFNTSSLIGNSIATVALTVYAGSYAGPTSGYLEARAAGDLGGTLTTADWIAATTWASKTLCARKATSALPASAGPTAVNFDSQAGFPGSINTGGTTWIAIAFDLIAGAAWPSSNQDIDLVSAYETGTTEDPRLVIEYQPSGNALFCGAQF